MFALANTLAAAGFVPARTTLEAAMLDACRAAGASAWYVPDDYLTLGPELVGVSSASVAGTSGYFYTDFSPVVGKSYQITYQYSVTGGTSVQMSLGGSNVPSSTVGSGTVVYTITAANNNPLRCYSNAATAALSGISVKEVISAKDFQDSAGTLPSYLGGTVGLGFDAAGLVSAEKNTLPLSAWTLPAGFAADGSTIVCASASTSLSCYGTLGLASGKAHLITYTISEYSSGSIRPIVSSGVVGSVRSANGIYTEIITPSMAAGNFGFQPWTTNFTGKITVNSVREVSGNHVTQATAGNRPLVSRIPRKLGPELVTNGTFDADASWTKGTGWSISGGLATKAAGVGANLDQVANLSGKNVAVSFTVSGRTAGTVSALLVESGVGASTLGSASANGSFTFVGARPTTGLFRINSDSVFDGSIDNISVREVLELSNALTFDGANDSLAAAASVIGSSLSQPYTMIAWGKPSVIGATRCMVGDSLRAIRVDAAGKVSVVHTGPGSKAGTTTIVAGQPVVIEATWDGTTSNLYLNGVAESSSALSAPSGSVLATAIGQFGNSGGYWSGDIGGVVICPAVMTDAQRLAVRRFAASQMGLTL